MPVMVAEGRSGTSMGAVIVPLPETTVPSNQGAEVTGVVLKAPVDELQVLKRVLQLAKVVVGVVVEKEERATFVPFVPEDEVQFPIAYVDDEVRK